MPDSVERRFTARLEAWNHQQQNGGGAETDGEVDQPLTIITLVEFLSVMAGHPMAWCRIESRRTDDYVNTSWHHQLVCEHELGALTPTPGALPDKGECPYREVARYMRRLEMAREIGALPHIQYVSAVQSRAEYALVVAIELLRRHNHDWFIGAQAFVTRKVLEGVLDDLLTHEDWEALKRQLPILLAKGNADTLEPGRQLFTLNNLGLAGDPLAGLPNPAESC